MFHFKNIPLSKNNDVVNIKEKCREYYLNNNFEGLLDKNYKIIKLSYDEDMDKIIKFTNKYYRSGFHDYYIQFSKSANESVPYAITYNDKLIALTIVEYVNLHYNNNVYKCAYYNDLTIHPLFHSKNNKVSFDGNFLVNIFSFWLGYEAFVNNNVDCVMFQSKNNINLHKLCVTKIYIHPLTLAPYVCKVTPKPLDVKDNNYIIRKPTLEELRVINTDNGAVMYYEYRDDRLNAIINNEISFIDNDGNIIVMCRNIARHDLPLRSVVILYKKINNPQTFKHFYNKVAYILKNDYNIDMVVLNTNISSNDFLVNNFHFCFNDRITQYLYGINADVKNKDINIIFG